MGKYKSGELMLGFIFFALWFFNMMLNLYWLEKPTHAICFAILAGCAWISLWLKEIAVNLFPRR